MRTTLVALALGACVWGCASSSEGSSGVEPPAEEDIFLELEYAIELDPEGRPLAYETRLIFDDALFRQLCILPDADSFDDYEEIDRATGEVIIERGTTPVSVKCPADGIVTGPLHEELYPSSWCRVPDCVPEGSIAEGNEGQEY